MKMNEGLRIYIQRKQIEYCTAFGLVKRKRYDGTHSGARRALKEILSQFSCTKPHEIIDMQSI